MIKYRNANTGDVVEFDEPRIDLDARTNWSRVTDADLNDPAASIDDVIGSLASRGREQRNQIRAALLTFPGDEDTDPTPGDASDATEPTPADAVPSEPGPATATPTAPKGNAGLPEWRGYALNVCGATPEQIHGMSRDELRDEYGPRV